MSECKYPLVMALGLEAYDVFGIDVISAKILERLLQNAKRVYSDPSSDSWYYSKQEYSNSTALLIAVEELPKEPIKEEQAFFASFKESTILIPNELRGKNFTVIFEEIIE